MGSVRVPDPTGRRGRRGLHWTLVDRNDFVLVTDPARNDEVTGIVTTADLSALLRDLTGSFILLGEIENHLRALLDGLFTLTELHAAQSRGDDDDGVSGR